MKKTTKAIVKVLLGLILFLVVLLLAHPLWVAPVARTAANSVVPDVTGTGFSVGKVGLNLYNGRFSASGITLENPEGFSERTALRVGAVDVVVDMDSVTSNVVVIKEVIVDDVFISYVSKDGVNNFDAISANASGGGKKKTGDGAVSDGGEAETAESADGDKEQLRIVIRHLNVKDVSVKMGFITLPVPPITLTDVGEKSGGVTMVELGNQLIGAVMSAVGSAKDGAGALGAILGAGVKDLNGQLKSGDVKGAEESFRKGVDALKGAEDALKSFFK